MMECRAIAIEQTEQSDYFFRISFPENENEDLALIFGNEVKGVSQEVVSACDLVLEIPQFGTKHSLNISVSAGVVVWDIWSKFNAQKKP